MDSSDYLEKAKIGSRNGRKTKLVVRRKSIKNTAKYCARFESTTSKVHHVGPKRRTRTKTRNLAEPRQTAEKITYEKGDSAGSEEEEVV